MAAQRERLASEYPPKGRAPLKKEAFLRARAAAHAASGRTAAPEGAPALLAFTAEPAAAVGPRELYPIFVSLRGRRCLVVGGGPIAFQKTLDLLRCGAEVHVVATRWTADFEPLAVAGRLQRSTRAFERADLDGAFLAVAATDNPGVQMCVWEGAEARGMLCNVVDVPDLCNFQVPASVRRGSLTVSVSTEGKSPLFAAAVRDRLAALLPEDLGGGLERLAEARSIVRGLFPGSQPERRRALGRLLTPEAIDHLMEGRLAQFEAHWEQWKTALTE